MREPIVPVEGTPRRRRDRPIAEGGTRPHLGTCPACGAAVIHHRLAVSHATILLVPEPRAGARFVLFQGVAIPRGTFGIASDDAEDYGTVDFGAPWGFQRVGNHDLVDAPAVLLNAMRAIVVLGRPWRSVIRRTLHSFAGPYLVVVAGGGDFAVEAHLAGEGRRVALRLLAEAAELASKPINKDGACKQAAHFIAKSGEQRAT